MDLERIKQNFRLHPRRSKKAPKKPVAQTSEEKDQNVQSDAARASTPAPPDDTVDTDPSKPNSNSNSPQSEGKQVPSQESRKPVEKPLRKIDSGIGSPQTNSEKRRDQSRATAGNDRTDRTNVDETEHEENTTFRYKVSQQDDSIKLPSGSKTDRYTLIVDAGSDSDDYDLRPPAPKPKPPTLESLSELLFSAGHLNTLTHHPALLTKFTAFLQQYRPRDYPLLMRYLETSKAISAIEYANAVAGSAPALAPDTKGSQSKTSSVAAVVDDSFRKSSAAAFNTLVHTTLPSYITYSLIRVLSECLVDEITGRANPLMRDMVGGLSEVFCLTDPNQEDNPIVYASEEFYRLTGYEQDDVIGHNCRFLQGRKTQRESPRRIRASLDKGEEVYETLLNYRRDGRPFINVLMIAPLHDNKGKLKYQIGAQVDVSNLIQNGKALDGFQKYLSKKEVDERRQARGSSGPKESDLAKKKKALDKLRELSELFDLEESAIIQSHSRSSSQTREEDTKSVGSGNARRRLIDSDNSDEDSIYARDDDWQLGKAGPLGMSGKLPGIYENFMLIRPAPSLRIIFVSPKLRKFGDVLQDAFLGHVAAPSGTLSGLAESFRNGIPVSAKINFMPQYTKQREGTKMSPNERHEDEKFGHACWIAATPLLGSDDQVGVWMIVFVEKAQGKSKSIKTKRVDEVKIQKRQAGNTKQVERSTSATLRAAPAPSGTDKKGEADAKILDLPIKPIRLDDVVRAPVNPIRLDHVVRAPVKPIRLDRVVQAPVEPIILDRIVQAPIDNEASHSLPVVYQYHAADPVEEYHSADERRVTARSRASTASQAKGRLQSPTYLIATEENFVRPRMLGVVDRQSKRLTIHPDDDEEDQGARITDRSNHDPYRISGETDSLETAPERIINPDEIEPSIPSDIELSTDDDTSGFEEKTPTRPAIAGREAEFGFESEETVRHQSPLQSPPSDLAPLPEFAERRPTPRSNQSYKSRAAQRNGNLPAGLSYVNYLRHPGTSRQDSGEVERGRRKNRPRLDAN